MVEPCVKGRLANAFEFWEKDLEAPPFVMDIIRQGYSLPFSEFPPRCFLSNNRSALRNPQFVESAILELLEKQLINEHSFPPHCVNPLTVAEGKKLRLVIDLREVNKYLVKPKFRYEDLRSLSEVFEQGFWFFTWDLKSGYHHVDIFHPHQQFLGFAWDFEGVTRYFTFAVLPFGLSTACFCFTKLFRPLVRRWRLMSHNCFVYLDDGISGQHDYVSARAASLIQRSDLASSGFIPNECKSQWEPVQVGEWLGFLINTIQFMFQIPEAKLAKLKRSLESMILDGYATYRELARLAGFIISLSLAVGPIARLFTRQMYFFIQSRPSWDVSFTFSEALLQELKFWLLHIDSFNAFSIRGVFCAESTIYTDASDFAFGGYLATLGGEPVRGMFSPADVDSSSTYRELKAVFYVLKSYAVSLKHQRVKVFVDNMGASRILMVRSSKLHLQQIAVDIFSICLSFGISLDSQWLPREENARADLLSRFIDRDDWSLNPVVFQSLDARWGPHSVDRFSSYFNSQVVRFNSKYFSPGCAAVDALAQDWSSDNNWLCPPTHLIVAAVKHLRYHKGVGTIIIPEWPSASFWPFLHISPSRFHTFVKEFVVLPRLADLLIEGPGQREVYRKKPSVFVGCPSFNMLALRLDFR